MELASPRRPPPAILVLGAAAACRGDLDRVCQDAGLLADHATDRAAALAAFFDRGGHELVACIGDPTPEMEAIVATLRAIDPDLPLLRLPTAADLTAPALALPLRA